MLSLSLCPLHKFAKAYKNALPLRLWGVVFKVKLGRMVCPQMAPLSAPCIGTAWHVSGLLHPSNLSIWLPVCTRVRQQLVVSLSIRVLIEVNTLSSSYYCGRLKQRGLWSDHCQAVLPLHPQDKPPCPNASPLHPTAVVFLYHQHHMGTTTLLFVQLLEILNHQIAKC